MLGDECLEESGAEILLWFEVTSMADAVGGPFSANAACLKTHAVHTFVVVYFIFFNRCNTIEYIILYNIQNRKTEKV